jgi:putative ABC transport system ATP-binding protein
MLAVRNLQFSYGDMPVLAINKLNAQGHLLVQGASGSGKTTLLFVLAGLLEPQSGKVTLDDTDLAALRGSARDIYRGRNIGFVFQQPHLMSALTVLQNVLVAPFMAGEQPDSDHALHLLDKLGLADLAHRYPAQLSQGQQQRVGLARALVHKPKLVLADEPTSALDDDAAEAAITLLLESADEAGAQVVVTSHDSRITPYFKQVLKLEGQR